MPRGHLQVQTPQHPHHSWHQSRSQSTYCLGQQGQDSEMGWFHQFGSTTLDQLHVSRFQSNFNRLACNLLNQKKPIASSPPPRTQMSRPLPKLPTPPPVCSLVLQFPNKFHQFQRQNYQGRGNNPPRAPGPTHAIHQDPAEPIAPTSRSHAPNLSPPGNLTGSRVNKSIKAAFHARSSIPRAAHLAATTPYGKPTSRIFSNHYPHHPL